MPEIRSPSGGCSFTVNRAKDKQTFPRRVKPSEINHGYALNLDPKGVLVEEIKLSGALSLSHLCRLPPRRKHRKRPGSPTANLGVVPKSSSTIQSWSPSAPRLPDMALGPDRPAGSPGGNRRRRHLLGTRQDARSRLSGVPGARHATPPGALSEGRSTPQSPHVGRLDELDVAFDAGWRASVASMVSYTDVIDRIVPSPIDVWLWARLQGLPVPRRLVYVIDRRLVVDGVSEYANALAASLDAQQQPTVVTIRGMTIEQDWLADPVRLAVIVSTVDQVGCRLLFSG